MSGVSRSADGLPDSVHTVRSGWKLPAQWTGGSSGTQHQALEGPLPPPRSVLGGVPPPHICWVHFLL